MKFISSLCLFFLYFFLLCVAFVSMYGMVKAEDLTTSNLAPNISGFTESGGTSVGQGWGCSSGQYCTSGTNEGGGTYTSTFDVPLTEAELNQGFTLNSGITVNSHSSNSRLPSCANGVLQSGDCRDIFKLTITLKDSGTTVETFVHQEELTWSGLKDFNYTDTVGTNDYGILTGILQLYGIDAGYPVGYYGPQFSNPSLTIDYQTALITEDTTTLITDVMQTETEATIMNAATGGTGGTDITSSAVTVSVPSFQTYTNTASTVVNTPVDTSSSSSSVFTPPVDTSSASTETTMDSAPVIETAAAAPTIAPVAQQTETQQAEETQAETQIEEAMSEPTSESAPSPKAAAKAKPQKSKTQRQTASSSATGEVSVPITPAAAAQAVVSNIAPSQKYGSTAQTVTLVAMGMIANNRGLFKSPSIPDVANFFSSSSVPDGPSIVDPMQNYQVFGQSNGLHNELVESQWSK